MCIVVVASCLSVFLLSSSILAEYHCGAGLLFDDKIQMCNWEDDVRCPGALAATGETLSPTPRPTQKPNSLLEWDRSKKKRNHDKVSEVDRHFQVLM